jgi:hypothetical protein
MSESYAETLLRVRILLNKRMDQERAIAACQTVRYNDWTDCNDCSLRFSCYTERAFSKIGPPKNLP